MNRKGAFMPHGTPTGDFQMKMNNTIMNDEDHLQNHHHNHNSHSTNHHSVQEENNHYNFNQNNNHNHNYLKQNHYGTLFAILCFFIVFVSMPGNIGCQEINGINGDNLNGFSLGPEYQTTEFDPNKRGQHKFGDKCNDTMECGFAGSVCDSRQKICQCIPELPATNQIDKCGKLARINESCFFDEQCDHVTPRTHCLNGKCLCFLDLVPIVNKHGIIICEAAKQDEPQDLQYVDPAMIGILVVMFLMFIIICVVLRLFSRARWRENRTIFNTPNPRLMNVSLLRDNKLLHGHERRGSKMSVRAPSRQPSMASLRPHSPNPSLGSRRGSRGSSNASATSMRSNRSINGNNHPNGGGANAEQRPLNVRESVTVEITEPKA